MGNNSSKIQISIMTEADTAFATELTDIEKWGYLHEDFRRLILFEPRGCFVARKDNDRVGIVTSISYGDYGFIGTLIVRQEYRGHEIGEDLMSCAIDHLKGKGVLSIELDGVFPAVSLYRRLGFRDKYLSLRFFRPPAAASDSVTNSPIVESEQIETFDQKMTGLNRQRMLRQYYAEFSDSIFTVQKTDLSAYGLVRPRPEGKLAIGPFVAADGQTAELVLRSILARHATKGISIGVPGINNVMVDLLLQNGFLHTQPSVRMYLGPRKNYEKHIYGILSAEKG